MEKQRQSIGQILVGLGRITPENVDQALAYQKENGGYFGDALMAMGLITRDQLTWALAGQYDIPFVHLHPENIDVATASQVPAAWARQHLVLPVLRSGGTVTVVLDDPANVDKLEEVRRFTGALAVEPALSSAEMIRALIEAVHGAGNGPPVAFEKMISEAVEAGAESIGISVRPGRVVGWYRGERISFRTLDDQWAAELEQMVSPLSPLAHSPVHAVRHWPAILTVGSTLWKAECHAVGRGELVEWAARIEGRLPTPITGARVDEDLAVQIRQAAASGGATLRMHPCVPGGAQGIADAYTLEAAFPAFPFALGGEECRSVHLSDRPVAVASGLLYLLVRESMNESLAGLEPFAMQALTLGVDRMDPVLLETARRTAPLVGVYTRWADSSFAADFDLCLRTVDDELVWTRQG